MMSDANASLIRALVIGLAGAIVAGGAGLPAAPLIGSSLAVSVAAWAGVRLRMEPRLRNFGFLGIGLSLGSGIGPDTFSQIGHWLVSLALLVVSLAVTMWVGAQVLKRWFDCDPGTAVLASSPGTMSYALAMAEDGGGNVTSVLTIQSLRLLALASVLPVMVWLFVGDVAQAQRTVASLPSLAGLAVLGALAGWAIARCQIPAAWLIGGFLVSSLGHASGVATGVLPSWASFVAFALTGTTIGTRFSGMPITELARNFRAALAVAVIVSALSFAFALIVSRFTALPLGQVWVAFAPGGVEAMAAIGLAMGYDPAFVAVHHLTRIAVLMVLVPIFVRRMGQSS